MQGQLPNRPGRLRRLTRKLGLILASLLAGLLLVLLTVGLPLGPVLRRVCAQLEAAQPQTRWESSGGRLRLGWNGSLRVSVNAIGARRAAGGAPLAGIAGAGVQIPIANWIRLNFCPDEIRLRAPSAAGRQLATGEWEFWPASPPPAPAPAAAPFHLKDLPEAALPRPGHPLTATIEAPALELTPASGTVRTLAWKSVTAVISREAPASLRVELRSEPAATNPAPSLSARLSAEIPSDHIRLDSDVQIAALAEFLPLVPPAAGLRALGGSATLHLEAQVSLADPSAASGKLRLALASLAVEAADQPSRLAIPSVILDLDVQSGTTATARGELAVGAPGQPAVFAFSADVTPSTRSATFALTTRNVRFEQVRDWLPDLELPVAQSPVNASMQGRIGWQGSAVALSGFTARFSAGPGEIHPTPTSAAIGLPPLSAELKASGSFDRVLSGECELRSRIDAGAGSPVLLARARLAAPGGRFETSLELEETDLATVQPWFKALALPVAFEGRVAFSTHAAGAADPLALASADLTLRSHGLRITAPRWLPQPVAFAPIQFSATLSEGGRRGSFAPFTLAAGPLKIESAGASWSADAGRFDGSGSLAVGALRWADVAALLAPDLRRQLGAPEAALSEFALSSFSVRTTAAGSIGAAGIPQPESAGVEAEVRLAINGEPLAIRAGATADLKAGRVRATVEIPDFVQARWKLALLKDLPVPLIDAPARARFAADLELPVAGHPARLLGATWRIEADSGRLIPQGPLLRWLVGPLPLSRFAAGGRILDHFRQVTLDESEVQIGRGRLRFEKAEVVTPSTLLGAGTTPLELRTTWLAEDWYAEDFLPLLAPDLRTALPAELPPGRNGLRRLRADIAVAARLHPDATLEITDVAATQEAQLAIGGSAVPVDLRWSFDRATRVLRTEARMQPVNPAALGLPPPPNLPFAPADFDLPIELLAEAALPLPERFPGELKTPRFSLELKAGPGFLRKSRWLAVETPVERFQVSVGAGIDPLRLDRFNLLADFRGPTFEVRNVTADYGETLTAAAEIGAARLPLAWLLERLPRTLLPADLLATLDRIGIEGEVEKVRLVAQASLDPRKLDVPPRLAKLELAASLAGPGVRWDGQPAARIARVEIEGGPASLRVRINGLDAGPARIASAEATVADPFAATRRVEATVDWSADVAAIDAYLRRLRVPFTWPAGLEPAKLAGTLGGTLKASGPADPAADPADFALELRAHGASIAVPMAVPGASIGTVGFDLTASAAKGRVDGELALRPDSLSFAPYFGGPLPVTLRLTADTALKATETTVVVDLTAARLDLPPVAWRKAAGTAAQLRLKVKTADLLAVGAPPQVDFDLAAAGLPLGDWSARGVADFNPGFAGTYGGWKSATLTEARLGQTVLHAKARNAPGGTLEVEVDSPHIDGAALVRFVEKLIGDFNAVLSAPFVDSPRPVIVPPPNPGLPDLKATFTAEKIDLGGDRAFKAVTAAFSTRDGWPAGAVVRWRTGIQDYSIDWTGAASGDNLTVRFSDVGRLFTDVTTPLTLLGTAAIPPESMLAMARDFPLKLRGGELGFRGRFDLRTPGEFLTGRVQLDGLVFTKEIEVLSKIAGLAKREVKWRIPCKTIVAEKIGYGDLGFSASQFFLDGPIDIRADTITWTPWDSKLFLHGKVFGICFEIAGAPADQARFFLCDSSPVVRTFTQEDEWDFDAPKKKKPEKKDEKPPAK